MKQIHPGDIFYGRDIHTNWHPWTTFLVTSGRPIKGSGGEYAYKVTLFTEPYHWRLRGNPGWTGCAVEERTELFLLTIRRVGHLSDSHTWSKRFREWWKTIEARFSDWKWGIWVRLRFGKHYSNNPKFWDYYWKD